MIMRIARYLVALLAVLASGTSLASGGPLGIDHRLHTTTAASGSAAIRTC
jgi:hypothetical protein